MLDHEREENRRLRDENTRLLQFLDDRDNKIAMMEKEIQLLQQVFMFTMETVVKLYDTELL